MNAKLILIILRSILQELMPWLRDMAKKTESPFDDELLDILASLLEIKVR